MQDVVNDTEQPVPAHAITGDEALRHALAARDRYLEQHPHLRPLQAQIDELLDKSGNSDGRMAVLGTLMQGKLLELQRELRALAGVLQGALANKP